MSARGSLWQFLLWPIDKLTIFGHRLLRWTLEHTSAGRFVLYEEYRRGAEAGYTEGRLDA